MVAIKNAAPRYYLTGFKDESGRALPVTKEEIPQHLPLMYIHTQRGRENPELVAGKPMFDMYGAESFNERSKYFSHQTMFLNEIMSQGNMVMIKRVLGVGAERASMALFLEIVAEDVAQYDRDVNGLPLRDAAGDKILSGTTENGYRLAWSIAPLTNTDNLRGELVTAGALVGRAGETSQRYPILAFRADHGEFGNNVGIRLSFPGPATSNPADMSIIASEKAVVYRGQFVERKDANSIPVVTDSVLAERFVEFAMRENVVNPKLDKDLGIERLIEEYQSIDPNTGRVPQYGPFESMHVYQANIDTILGLLFANESTIVGAVDDMWMLNFMDNIDYNGNDHYTMVMDSSSIGMNEYTTHYALGGADGIIGEAALDTQIAVECRTNWENVDYPLLDDARYPFSILYDSGFSLDTKKAIISTIGYRQDISVAISTQVVGDPDNSISDETSIMTSLRAYARLIPESVIHGTPVARVVVFGQVGEKLYTKYGKKLPLLLELAKKRARYMGAGDGRYKRQFAYDVAPANRITSMVNVSNPWKPDLVRDNDWEIGLNWAQFADLHQLFVPAVQTVYDDDTSVLNNDINMLIAVDVAKMSTEVWRQMTGNTTYTDAQFIDACNAKLLELVANRYDDRVTIVPNTYFTAADEARGYSWTQDIHVYMNTMRTVGVFNIITHRSSDLLNP